MILPTKGIPANKALISLAGDVLRALSEPMTVSRLWDEFKKKANGGDETTFDWFVLSLDLLYLLGTVELSRGRIWRAHDKRQEDQ